MMKWLKWLKKLWMDRSVDVSQHRQHTTKYEDLCM